MGNRRTMGLIVDRVQLCAAMAVSDSSITAWEKRGLPVVRKGRGRGMKSLYDLDAVRAWCSETGYGNTTQAFLAQASRPDSTPPSERSASAAVSQTAPKSMPIDPYDADALRFSPAYDVGLVSLPAHLDKEGLSREAIDRVLANLYQAMIAELRARHENEDFIRREMDLLRQRVSEEREAPGTWTT